MIRATNQSGVFYMGSSSFRPTASAEYRAMPLAFGLNPENDIEYSRQATVHFNIRDKTSPIQPIWRIGEGL
jgi:hypothetical protein